jgi:hypothetical protein
LLGLGVAWSVEAHFHLPHASLIGSPLDLLELSSWALVILLKVAGELLPKWQVYGTMALSNLYDFGVKVAWSLLIFGVTFLAYKLVRWIAMVLWRFTTWVARWARGWSPIDRVFRTGGQFCVRQVKGLSFAPKLVRTLLGYAALVALGPPLLFLVGAPIFISMLLVIPLLGNAAGDRYISDNVLQPLPCRPLEPLAARLKALHPKAEVRRTVSCVEAQQDGRPTERGQVVIATSTAMLLYHPDSGATTRVPLEGSTLRAVESLELPVNTLSTQESQPSSK